MRPPAVLMKRKMLTGAGIWVLLISLLHVQLNVGWNQAATSARVSVGLERPGLSVGFLPVT